MSPFGRLLNTPTPLLQTSYDGRGGFTNTYYVSESLERMFAVPTDLGDVTTRVVTSTTWDRGLRVDVEGDFTSSHDGEGTGPQSPVSPFLPVLLSLPEEGSGISVTGRISCCRRNFFEKDL